MIAFESVVIALTVYYKSRIMHESLSNMMISSMEYRKLAYSSPDELDSIPTWLGIANTIVKAAGYWFAYIIFNNRFNAKHNEPSCIVIVLLSIISSLLGGGRGGAIDLIICMFVFYIICIYRKNKSYRIISITPFLRIFVVALIIIFTFQMLGDFVGRVSTLSLMDYLAEYFGAEIVNLDIFLEDPSPRNEIWGNQTFIYLVKMIGPHIGLDASYYLLDQPFHFNNGYNLGNVATTFYSFIYDFGYWGVFYLTTAMAITSQLLYEHILKNNFTVRSFHLLIYAYVYATLILSFFSNKFYEKLFSKGFLVLAFVWLFFDICFTNRNKQKTVVTPEA